MKLFLGVDGGQSGTTAIVGDENGRIIGEGRAGPANDPAADLESVLRAAASAALQGEEAEFESACFGFSGAAENKDAVVRRAIRAKQYSIAHDALIALAGATAGEPGVVVIAGTGSIAFGRNAEQRTARAGGWGYAFGDEGGAFDIVRQAVRAALRFEEGWGPATALHHALIEVEKAASANDLLHRFYTRDFPRARVAALAPLVDEIARSGDRVAIEIFNAAAQSLATIAVAVRAQLFAAEDAVTFSYAGGAFHSAMLLERFRILIELNERNRLITPRFSPAEGALIEAWRIAGVFPETRGANVVPPY